MFEKTTNKRKRGHGWPIFKALYMATDMTVIKYLHACNTIVIAGQVIKDDEVTPLHDLGQDGLIQVGQLPGRGEVQRGLGIRIRVPDQKLSDRHRHGRLGQVWQPLDEGDDRIAGPILVRLVGFQDAPLGRLDLK